MKNSEVKMIDRVSTWAWRFSGTWAMVDYTSSETVSHDDHSLFLGYLRFNEVSYLCTIVWCPSLRKEE